MMQVVTNLHALGAIAQKLGVGGDRCIGVKVTDANVREFTAEQLSAGRAEQTFIGKGSSGQATACSIDRRKEIDRMKHRCRVAKMHHATPVPQVKALDSKLHKPA